MVDGGADPPFCGAPSAAALATRSGEERHALPRGSDPR
jgi:hypothetical protein